MANENQSALNLLQFHLSRTNAETTNLIELNKLYENIKLHQQHQQQQFREQNYQKSFCIPIYSNNNISSSSNTNLASSASSTASSLSMHSLNKNFMNLSLNNQLLFNQQQQQQQLSTSIKSSQLPTSATFTAPLPVTTISPSSSSNDIVKLIDRKKLFVGNLPSNTRLCELLELFKKFGKINEKLSVVKDQNYAFIHFYNENDAKIALDEINDSLFKNRYIRVQYSTSQAHIKKSKTFDTATGLSSSSISATNQQLKAKFIEEQINQQQKQQQQPIRPPLRAITGGNRCFLLQQEHEQQQQQYMRQLLSINNFNYLNNIQFNENNNNNNNNTYSNESLLLLQQPLIGNSNMIKSNTIASFQNNQ